MDVASLLNLSSNLTVFLCGTASQVQGVTAPTNRTAALSGCLTRFRTSIMVYPDSQSCSQSPRPLGRAFPPSGIDAQWIPEAALPACVIATLVVPTCVPEKETQSGVQSGPFSANRFSILPRTELWNPVK